MEKAMELKARSLGPKESTDLAFSLASVIAKAQAVELALEEEESAWSGPELIELLKIFQNDATEALAVLGITQDEYNAILGEIVAEMKSDEEHHLAHPSRRAPAPAIAFAPASQTSRTSTAPHV